MIYDKSFLLHSASFCLAGWRWVSGQIVSHCHQPELQSGSSSSRGPVGPQTSLELPDRTAHRAEGLSVISFLEKKKPKCLKGFNVLNTPFPPFFLLCPFQVNAWFNYRQCCWSCSPIAFLPTGRQILPWYGWLILLRPGKLQAVTPESRHTASCHSQHRFLLKLFWGFNNWTN